MGILVSGFARNGADFSPASNDAIDAASFPLSEGNWREHLSELFLGEPCEEDMPADRVQQAAEAFIAYHEGKINLGAQTLWHIEIARKVHALAVLTQAHGGDTVGVAG